MFLKTNQGLGRTYRNKKGTKEQKQNQTKQNQKEEEEKKRATLPKTCTLVLMVVYAKQRKVGEVPTFHQFLTVVASVLN